MRFRLHGLVLILGMVLMVACSHFRHLLGVVADKPEVRLISVDIRSATLKQMDLDFSLEVKNPNGFAIELEQLDYSVQGLDLVLGTGSHKDTISIPSHAKINVSLPFKVNTDMFGELMKRYLQNPTELKLKLLAKLYLGTALGKIDLTFEEEKVVLRGFVPQ